MALQITFTDNDVGVACPSADCSICGGIPPYTVTINHPGAKVTKISTFLYRIEPPESGVPLGNPSAYSIGYNYGKGCSFGQCGCQCICKIYKCNGAFAGDCFNASELTCTKNGKHHAYLCHNNGCLTHPECLGNCAGACPNCTEGPGQDTCPGTPFPPYSAGDVLDWRTQQNINDGCRPCVPEMDGKVVTVTDSLGTSVSRTLKGFDPA